MIFRMNFAFSKKASMRFISHLDLMRLFMRALRRADIPVKISQGFHPHPKLSLARALKLGVESENEEASVSLQRLITPPEFVRRLQAQMPPGITIINASLFERL